MASAQTAHPYLDLFVASLVPRMTHGPAHDHDPPPPALLALPGTLPEAQQVLDLLLGADRDVRQDQARAAAINLDLAETRLRLAMAHGSVTPRQEAALASIARAKEEVMRGATDRACAALAWALKQLQRPV
ncbi:hypothetical protein JYK14_22795 [Siccirubricoccus sp. KC 17139]|uniref:ANTAR domain-containing protein n=1 Tax=Siccirubricoccus soli TaxID=2899147 RepID=A0ABT1DCQ2_9PROT|nr:hypothetical protein [Siccirubricoccus soli]MCO6418964.1 hypothetical protein [Siccirubricoccus soli]MCP2685099.1 hypothetical protein [Siccirubricoccus soli]